MKFNIQQQNGLRESNHTVWDAVDEKPLCTFVNGEFETEDATVIKKLVALGYGYDLINDEPEDEEAIRSKAKELGITSVHLKKIDTLKKEIAEKE